MLVSPSDFRGKLERMSYSSQRTRPTGRVLWEELLVLEKMSSQCTCPTGRVLLEELLIFLDFTRNYERTSGLFVPCTLMGEPFLVYKGLILVFRLPTKCKVYFHCIYGIECMLVFLFQAPTRHLIEDRSIPIFYVNKLQYQNYGKPVIALSIL